MGMRGSVQSTMIELHRFGASNGIIRKGEHYIRTVGSDTPACEVEMPLDHRDLLLRLADLRYAANATPADVAKACADLASHAAKILGPLSHPNPQGLVQVDLVTAAAELWAFPFEAVLLADEDGRIPIDRGVVLTRRIRGEFAARALRWPARPKVLFVHAPAARDLEAVLIDAHEQALRHALVPWGTKDTAPDLLTTEVVLGPEDLAAAVNRLKPTHVHVLAHGAKVPDPDLPGATRWGLRLGLPSAPGTDPKDIAAALQAPDDHPVVVTLAACDAANQGDPAMGDYSLAQELHRRGVPVVIASQLPLTKCGSIVLTHHFYEPLLRGEDVRWALHDARTALQRSKEAHHDWLSVVSYVRLPEGYSDHLFEVALRAEFGMLEAAQRLADRLSSHGGSVDEFTRVEELVRARIDSLAAKLAEARTSRVRGLAQECTSLLASAYKRLAELLFRRAKLEPVNRERYLTESRLELQRSLEQYRNAYRSNIDDHWAGVQQLALGAALEGRFAHEHDWLIVHRVAELARDEDTNDYWACGSLAETLLLAPIARGSPELMHAHAALQTMRARAPADDPYPLASTRRQLERYVSWWTTENGFFQGCASDLSNDAKQLLEMFDRERNDR